MGNAISADPGGVLSHQVYAVVYVFCMRVSETFDAGGGEDGVGVTGVAEGAGEAGGAGVDGWVRTGGDGCVRCLRAPHRWEVAYDAAVIVVVVAILGAVSVSVVERTGCVNDMMPVPSSAANAINSASSCACRLAISPL